MFAVWLPFLAGSEQAANIAQRVLPDPRVVHLWDGAAVTSSWFAKNVDHTSSPVWDAYYLYGPTATWANIPGPLVSSGSSILGQSSRLGATIQPVLRSADPRS